MRQDGWYVHNISCVKLLGTNWLELAIQITAHKDNKLCQLKQGPNIIFTVGALNLMATVNQHPPVHHPLDACYDSVVDDPQLSYYPVSSW